MSTNLANLLYLIPIVAFILALRFLSNPAHARRGNQIGAAGMLVAIVVTWIHAGSTSWWAIVIGMAIGGARQTKKTNLEAKNPPRKPETHTFPGFLVPRFPCNLSFPVIRDIPVIRG